MAYPTDLIATGDLVTAAQINRWPVLLADSLLGSSAASFDFTAIPAHWSHLRIELYLRGDQATTSTLILVRFNNDSGANYDWLAVNLRHSASLTTGEGLAATFINPGSVAAANAPTSAFDSATLDIPGYAGTTGRKVLTSYGTLKINEVTNNLYLQPGAGWWRNTAAINRVTILPGSGNWVTGSRASLYGMGKI